MAYRGLTIIFASFLIFLGQFGYSNGQCADGGCYVTDLGTSENLQSESVSEPDAEDCYSNGTLVTLSCDGPGLALEGESENTCNNGTWEYGQATCNEFNCAPPTHTDENLDWTDKGEKETYDGDETITYSCTEGFKLEGSETNTCIDQDKWQLEEDPTCSAFNCSAPASTDKNLSWTDKGEKDTYNGTEPITYSCSDGLTLEGSETNTCIDQDKWKNEDPTCSGNVVQVFWYLLLMTTCYSVFSFNM